MGREIPLRVFRLGFSSVQFFKSRDESVNSVRIFLQFHLNPPGRRIIITSAGQRPVNEQEVLVRLGMRYALRGEPAPVQQFAFSITV